MKCGLKSTQTQVLWMAVMCTTPLLHPPASKYGLCFLLKLINLEVSQNTDTLYFICNNFLVQKCLSQMTVSQTMLNTAAERNLWCSELL